MSEEKWLQSSLQNDGATYHSIAEEIPCSPTIGKIIDRREQEHVVGGGKFGFELQIIERETASLAN